MPPKNKKKSAAAKRKEIEELAQQEQTAAEDESEFQKACLEIRVKELENLNLGLQRKSEYLESQNDVYKAQLTDLTEEKEDLVAHLERCFSEAKTNAKELEDRLYGTHQARLEDKISFKEELIKKDKAIQDLNEKMGKQIMEAEAKLTSLEEFRIQKENLTLEKNQLKNSLDEEREKFARNYDELENNLIRYREKLKNDSVTMMKKMACDVQRAGKLCLTATVKSAITENIRLQNELEKTSKENLELRENLEKLTKLYREKRMTVEVIEEENSILHKKCLQYRLMTQELLDRQILLERRIESCMTLEEQFFNLKATHAVCLSEEDIEIRISESVDKALAYHKDHLILVDESAEISSPREDDLEMTSGLNDLEVQRLKDAIVKMAIASKELSQAENSEEIEFFKERFKLMIVNVFHLACDIPDLSPEVKKLLEFPVPPVTAYISFK